MVYILLVHLFIYFARVNPYKPSVPFFGTKANSEDPDHTPQNAESDPGLHCLPTRKSIRNIIKMKGVHQTPVKLKMDSSN